MDFLLLLVLPMQISKGIQWLCTLVDNGIHYHAWPIFCLQRQLSGPDYCACGETYTQCPTYSNKSNCPPRTSTTITRDLWLCYLFIKSSRSFHKITPVQSLVWTLFIDGRDCGLSMLSIVMLLWRLINFAKLWLSLWWNLGILANGYEYRSLSACLCLLLGKLSNTLDDLSIRFIFNFLSFVIFESL